MWTAPLRKNITVQHVGMARENMKHMVMTSLCETQKTNKFLFKVLFKTIGVMEFVVEG